MWYGIEGVVVFVFTALFFYSHGRSVEAEVQAFKQSAIAEGKRIAQRLGVNS